MALAADAQYFRRGPEPTRNEFGYPPAANAVIYAGAMLGLTATGTLQPIQNSGSVVFGGMAASASNTAAQPQALPFVVGMLGTWQINVPGATYANIHQPVYATDDNTLTLTAGSNLQVGTLAGIEGGLTYVNLLGS